MLRSVIVSAPLKVIIACGGTGGHLFPGIAVAQELESRGHKVILLISEKEVDAEASQKYSALRFETIRAIAKPPTFSLKMVPFLWKLWKTIGRCRKIIDDEQADVVLGMGGFTSFAPVYAGAKKGLKTYVHESNAIPGRSNLLTAKHCSKILVGMKEATAHFGNVEVLHVGTPVRSELEKLPSREEASETFGLNPKQKTLLVMGGSQGAQQLNEVVATGSEESGWQVLHLAGRSDYQRIKKMVEGRGGYHVLPFCNQMAQAYAASDFCVARSGASSLTELSWAGLPALLVPYPFAADDHQTANAVVYERANAAILKTQDEVDAGLIKEMLFSLNDEIIATMNQAMLSLADSDSARKIAAVIEDDH